MKEVEVILVDALGMVTRGLKKRLEELEIRVHSDHSGIKISKYTEKSPRDLREPAANNISEKPV